MDYGVRILKELFKKIKNMPTSELKELVNEADTEYKKIKSKPIEKDLTLEEKRYKYIMENYSDIKTF